MDIEEQQLNKPQVLEFREVDRDKFEAIANGQKRFETRAGNPEYLLIKPGLVTFMCGEDRIEKNIVGIYHYKSIKELLTHIPLEQILPDIASSEEAENIYDNFPGYKERLVKYGVLAFELSMTEK